MNSNVKTTSVTLPAHTSAILQSVVKLALAQTLTVVAVHMEGEEKQFHRYATAGPLSLCPVVVVKVYIATIYGRCNYGMWRFQAINDFTLILPGSTSSSHFCIMKVKTLFVFYYAPCCECTFKSGVAARFFHNLERN
jgi:hypothetical protein